MAISIRAREFGRGPASVHHFKTLAALQAYVRDRWEGVEYIDSPRSFHNDYCTFDLVGASLLDLGRRAGERGTDGYWDWIWHDLTILGCCQNCGGTLKEHGVRKPYRCATRLNDTYWMPWTLAEYERAQREGGAK